MKRAHKLFIGHNPEEKLTVLHIASLTICNSLSSSTNTSKESSLMSSRGGFKEMRMRVNLRTADKEVHSQGEEETAGDPCRPSCKGK